MIHLTALVICIIFINKTLSQFNFTTYSFIYDDDDDAPNHAIKEQKLNQIKTFIPTTIHNYSFFFFL